jgi:hypothetical protein
MVQPLGGVTAVQVRPIELEEVAVAAKFAGAEGAAVQLVVEVRGSGTATIGNDTEPLVRPGAVAVTVTVPVVNWLRSAIFVRPPSTWSSGSPGE